MFDKLSRSWEFAKISYGIIWDFKQLVIFPIISAIAAVLVSASFLLPLWSTGTLEQWSQFMDEESTGQSNVVMYVTLFFFYFCNYFVIVFFNSALTACAMRVIAGEAPSIGYGLSAASRRLPQIIGWALLSAVVGVLLKVIENANEKVGRLISGLLGMAWTIMTYFVVPVIVIDGVGPIEAFKRSAGTLKRTWGEALVGNFSLGLLSLLLMLPIIVVAVVLVMLAASAQSTVLLVIAIALAVIIVAIGAATTSAADVIFKALLFNYATDRAIPQGIDRSTFDDAFGRRE